ncbi:MAG: thioredoxin family protein [Bacteroidales bacterium]|nr:thioredoxin family protein [Bacteroidales bacterium]MBN2757185.1 thioredoxin family protein [Bacteroidales bacterium]
MINTIESLEYYENAIEKHDAVLFYFSHEECNVCKVLKPKVDELLTNDFPEMKMYYCDTKNLPELAAQNSIFAVPTILVYFGTKESIRKSRNIGLQELNDLITRPYEMIF